MGQVEWKSELLLANSGVNLRNGRACQHREPAKICTEREQFFLNRVIPLWNNLPQKVKEAKTLNSFKAEFKTVLSPSLSKNEKFLILICIIQSTLVIKDEMAPRFMSVIS